MGAAPLDRGSDRRTEATTPKQCEYLDYIRQYIALHREPPAEADLAAFFRVSPSAVHQMVVTLTAKGLITRAPGKARSIRIVEEPDPLADEERPTRPPGEITEPLDAEIAPLVDALGSDGSVITKGSCCGHGRECAYVDLAVEGLPGLRLFVERMNLVDREVRTQALLDLHVNWSEEVVSSCAFDIFPEWIMLSFAVEGLNRNGAPSARLLSKIAQRWTAAVARTARREIVPQAARGAALPLRRRAAVRQRMGHVPAHGRAADRGRC